MMIAICDSTLRDGNHAVRHQLGLSEIKLYAEAAERAGVNIVEVGHGNGLGASSLQVGRTVETDSAMLRVARSVLHTAKLGILSIPGFATIERHLKPALDLGVDSVRVGAHCTEADVTQQQIALLASADVEAIGVLMMSHMASPRELAVEALKMESYGARGVVLMDSAGAFLPDDVTQKVSGLVEALDIPVGFHAHNNLGLAVANTVCAVDAGASIIDVTAKGFGAGAGNAPLELIAATLMRLGIQTQVDWRAAIEASELAGANFVRPPASTALTIASGIAGVFSGFVPPAVRSAEQFGIDPISLLLELGRRGIVAGQEDAIVNVASLMAGAEARSAD